MRIRARQSDAPDTPAFPRRAGFLRLATRGLLWALMLWGCAGPLPAAEQPAPWNGLRAVWYPLWGAFLAFPNDELKREMPAKDITALVVGVAQGSAAEQANLARGDWIVPSGQKLVDDVGQTHSVMIDRGGTRYSVSITTRAHDFNTAALVRPSAKNVAPRRLVVDRSGQGSYRTIVRALSQARPGDTVEVRDGLYREELVVPHGVTLEAAADGMVQVEAPSPLRLIGTDQCVVRNLSFRAVDKPAGVYVQHGGQHRFENLTVARDQEAEGSALVYLTRVDQLVLQSCSLLGTPKCAGFVASESQARLTDSSVVQCWDGITVRDKSTVVATGNWLDGNTHGIRTFDSSLTAQNNTITGIDGQTGSGVVIVRSSVVLRGNVVRRQSYGLYAITGRGTVEGNTLAQCEYGADVNAGTLTFTGNTISTNKHIGIFLADAKDEVDPADRTIITKNTIAFNGASGITVRKHPATISQNVLEGNDTGIRLVEGPAEISQNTIVVQGYVGIHADATAQGSVFNNIIALGRVGIRMDSRARLQRESNVVFGHYGARRVPLVDLNYLCDERLPLSNGDLLRVLIYPAANVQGKGDLQIDPRFVQIGSDYRLAADSPLFNKPGKDGKLVGALPATN